MSWFTGYYEFGAQLTDMMIQEYELLYPAMKYREITSRQEKQQLMALTASGFNWDSIKFKNQFFKREDYQPFLTSSAAHDNASLRLGRIEVQNKLTQLQEMLKAQMDSFKLEIDRTSTGLVSSIEPKEHPDQKIRSMWISYQKNNPRLSADFIALQVGITQLNINVRLRVLGFGSKQKERDYFNDQMESEPYRAVLFANLNALGAGYMMEVAGVKRSVDSLLNEAAMSDFIRSDYAMHFGIIIEKTYYPGDPAVSNDKIVSTILGEFMKLMPLYDNV
jgi:hypothetical protein